MEAVFINNTIDPETGDIRSQLVTIETPVHEIDQTPPVKVDAPITDPTLTAFYDPQDQGDG